MRTIAVHGATGSQSAPVASRLSAAGHEVRPLSLSVGVDFLDRLSLVAAYACVDTVVLHLPLVYDERALVMADNVADAAAAAGVAHLVLNASAPLPPQPIGIPFLDARHRVAAANVPRVTVLQPTLYLENVVGPWMTSRILADGIVAYPLPGDVPVPWVGTDDVAVAVERAISRDVTGWFVLPGVPASGQEIAVAIGDRLGRPLRWQTITPDQYGDHAADNVAATYRALAAAPPAPMPDPAPAREALDWAPRDLAAWAARLPAFTRAVPAAAS
jgi:nucleoside-diphosphate-sugar epimerase